MAEATEHVPLGNISPEVQRTAETDPQGLQQRQLHARAQYYLREVDENSQSQVSPFVELVIKREKMSCCNSHVDILHKFLTMALL